MAEFPNDPAQATEIGSPRPIRFSDRIGMNRAAAISSTAAAVPSRPAIARVGRWPPLT
jgi:hypothetical protein